MTIEDLKQWKITDSKIINSITVNVCQKDNIIAAYFDAKKNTSRKSYVKYFLTGARRMDFYAAYLFEKAAKPIQKYNLTH